MFRSQFRRVPSQDPPGMELGPLTPNRRTHAEDRTPETPSDSTRRWFQLSPHRDVCMCLLQHSLQRNPEFRCSAEKIAAEFLRISTSLVFDSTFGSGRLTSGAPRCLGKRTGASFRFQSRKSEDCFLPHYCDHTDVRNSMCWISSCHRGRHALKELSPDLLGAVGIHHTDIVNATKPAQPSTFNDHPQYCFRLGGNRVRGRCHLPAEGDPGIGHGCSLGFLVSRKHVGVSHYYPCSLCPGHIQFLSSTRRRHGRSSNIQSDRV